ADMRRPHHCLLALGCSALIFSAVVAEEDANRASLTTAPAEIDRLIKQLGSDEFSERDAASKALDAIGEPAREALLKASRSDDAEVRQRAEHLLKALDVKVYRELRCFEGHPDCVVAVAFSPDGKRALAGTKDSAVLWDVETGKELLRLKGHTDWVWSVAF